MNLVSKLTKPAKNVLARQLALCSRAKVSRVLMHSRANVPCVLRCARSNVTCVPRCQRAYVLMCKRAMLSNVNSYIIQIC